MKYQVRILLIDSDEIFQQRFNRLINAEIDDVLCQIKSCDNCRTTEMGEYDIYVCGSVDSIMSVKKRDASAAIFVLTESDNPDLLKKITKLNVDGLIDPGLFDLSSLVQEIRSLAETYSKVDTMVQKLNKIATLKSVA